MAETAIMTTTTASGKLSEVWGIAVSAFTKPGLPVSCPVAPPDVAVLSDAAGFVPGAGASSSTHQVKSAVMVRFWYSLPALVGRATVTR